MTYSIIIPQRNSLHTLPRLFASIPEREDIEILLVDNTPTPVTKEEIGIDRDYKLLWSAPERHAGGARNVGIDNAQGEWLIFADADDYFTEDAFEVFDANRGSDADVIYFSSEGRYSDTGQYSDRADSYARTVRGYLNGEIPEISIRLGMAVPWAKMVRKSFVAEGDFRYDEVRAANDIFFATKIGYYAHKVEAVDKIVYIATVSRGSLTQRITYDVIHARYEVSLQRNKFLREHNLGQYQCSVMYFLYRSLRFGPKVVLSMLWDAIKMRQNLFVGCGNWLKTIAKSGEKKADREKYQVK